MQSAILATRQRRDYIPLALENVAVIDRDLTTVAPETIRDAKIVMTVVDGRVVFER